ncbi:MAG: DUF6950 family protein [Alphaproteobacteria bacterium]
MRRLPDWHARLTRWLVAQAGRRWRPGSVDCALFAAGAVRAQTGIDLARGLRGRYRSVRAGVALLRARGFDGPEAFLAAHLPAVPRLRARTGDIAVIDTPAGPAFGVLDGEAVHVLHPRGGPGLVPATTARAFHAVGRCPR